MIVLLPFLYQYKGPFNGISFGEFLLVPFILYYLVMKRSYKIALNKYDGYYIYVFVAIFLTFFALPQEHFNINDFLTTFLRIIYYCVLICIAYGKVDIKFAMKVALISSAVFSAYAVLQFVTYKLTGNILPTVIDPNWVNSSEAGIRLDYDLYYKWTYRSSSLFLEPSYFAAFASVGLSAGLFFFNKEKIAFYLSLLITAGMIASTSSAALVILIIVWGLFFYYNFVNKKISIRTLLIGIVFLLFAVVLLSSSMATVLLERTASGASFNNRIIRGVQISETLSPYQYIFGVGINNLGSFVKYHNIATIYDEIGMENYASSLIGTLLSSGLITLFFYVRHYFRMWTNKNNDTLSRSLIMIFTFLSIIEMNSFSYRSAFFLILIFNMHYAINENKKRNSL